jgi:DNA-binding IclR family transcriptional regulator
VKVWREDALLNDAASEASSLPRQKGIQSVEIGCDLLRCLSELHSPATLTEIASALGMSASKAYFYVTSFVRKGLVRKDEDGRYRLGPSALNLGLAALAQVDAIEEARQVMVRIRSSVDESIHLSVWGSAGPTVVHRLPAPHWQLEIRLGAVLAPLTASGRSLMTAFPDEAVATIIREELTRSKPSDPWHRFSLEKAMKIFAEDRRRGLSRGFGSVYPGATSLAAPVRDQSGNTVGAITILGANDRFDLSYEGPVAKALLSGVRSIGG